MLPRYFLTAATCAVLRLDSQESDVTVAAKNALGLSLVLVLSVAACAVVREGAAPVAEATQSWSDRELIARLNENGLQARTSARGIVVLLPDILFALDDVRLAPEARVEIRKAAMVLSESQAAEREISVEGHTDSSGPASYNLELSRRRAEAVARELVLNGIRRERITAVGFGETRPLVLRYTPARSTRSPGDSRNRRVEIIIKRLADVSASPRGEIARDSQLRLGEGIAIDAKATRSASAV